MIKKYNEIIDEIVFEFIKRYFKENYNEEAEKSDYRIMDYKGVNTGPVEISDYYFPLEEILICENHKIPTKYLKEFYEDGLKASYENKSLGVNFYNYWRKKSDLAKYEKEEKESLEKSQKKCEEIKEYFLKLLQNGGNNN